MKAPPGLDENGKPHQAMEYIELFPGHMDSKDTVRRAATDEDRLKWKHEYAEFREAAKDGKEPVEEPARPGPGVTTSVEQDERFRLEREQSKRGEQASAVKTQNAEQDKGGEPVGDIAPEKGLTPEESVMLNQLEAEAGQGGDADGSRHRSRRHK